MKPEQQPEDFEQQDSEFFKQYLEPQIKKPSSIRGIFMNALPDVRERLLMHVKQIRYQTNYQDIKVIPTFGLVTRSPVTPVLGGIIERYKANMPQFHNESSEEYLLRFAMPDTYSALNTALARIIDDFLEEAGRIGGFIKDSENFKATFARHILFETQTRSRVSVFAGLIKNELVPFYGENPDEIYNYFAIKETERRSHTNGNAHDIITAGETTSDEPES